MLVLGFFIGLIAEFVFARIADKQCKISGDECGYDCVNCSCHCVGYHCHLMRSQIIEQNCISNCEIVGEETIDNTEAI